MCEFCSEHGEGKVWFKNAANYAKDLMSDLERRKYISDFFTSTMQEGIITIGRLETIYKKKKRLPVRLTKSLISQAKEDHFGQVVTIEDIREIIKHAATIVRMPCACQWTASKKEDRCCYSVSYTPDAWYNDLDMGYFGLADDVGLESLRPEEAIEQIEKMGLEGAVHSIWTMKTPFIGAICNCKPSDCLGLRTLSLDVETMFKGEMVAIVDDEKCNGCGECQEACYFNAIDTKTVFGDDRAVVQKHKCYGCGLCRKNCAQNALSMIDR